jgi:hypothetical protein
MTDDSYEKTVIDAGLFRFPGQDFVRNINKPYTLYYDETNNIRSLSLTGTGLNHEVLDCFVLGGVALGPGTSLPDIDALRALLRIQPSVKELKLKHLAHGDYITCLSSNKLEQFLRWLLASPGYIHFSNFSILNWSIVDLIDSLLDHDQFQAYTSIRDALKNELHAMVRPEPLGYFRLRANTRISKSCTPVSLQGRLHVQKHGKNGALRPSPGGFQCHFAGVSLRQREG